MKSIKLILFFSILCYTLFAENRQLDSLQSCLKIAKDDSTRASIITNIGTFYMDNGNFPSAIENLLKSKKIFETLRNEDGVFDCHNRLAITYAHIGDNKTALEYLMKCKHKKDDGRLYDNLGFIYYNQNNIEQAKKYWDKSLGYYKEKHDNKMVARLLNKIGSCLEVNGQIENAILNYNQSLKMAEDKMDVLNAYASLGDIYFSQKKYFIALQYEIKSLNISKQIGDLLSMRETLKIMSDIYLKLGDCKTSLSFYKNYIEIKTKLVNEDNIKQIVRIEENSKFETEKKIAKSEQDKKDAIKQEEIRHQRNQRNIFIGGFGLVFCLSIFLFRAFKKNQKAKIIITEQKRLVEEKKKEMTDNINYAQRIQKAILPSDEYINKCFSDNFIIYHPKDIVSGDFYWAYNDGSSKYLATADCTGHGVSGAMMSMIGTQLLNEIVIERKITSPELVLNTLRDEIIKSLNQEGASEERKDGMDISFVKITNMKLECACANNPIYIIRHAQVIEIKANRFPVGKYVGEEKFSLNSFDLQKDDIIYTLSDGFCDQFGGDKGKKLMTKRFKEWVTEIPYVNMNNAKEEIENRFSNWIGEGEQIDDVSIMAIKF